MTMWRARRREQRGIRGECDRQRRRLATFRLTDKTQSTQFVTVQEDLDHKRNRSYGWKVSRLNHVLAFILPVGNNCIFFSLLFTRHYGFFYFQAFTLFCVMMYDDTKNSLDAKCSDQNYSNGFEKNDLQQKHQKTNLSKGFFLPDTSKVLVLDLF